MKIYRTIAVFDVVVAANNPEDARATLEKWLHGYGGTETPLPPNECTATEITQAREVREQMKAKKPIIGETLTNDEFASIKGRTNLELFEFLHAKKK